MATIESSAAKKTLEQLCREASRETDCDKLMELVEEIERRFDEKHRMARLRGPNRGGAVSETVSLLKAAGARQAS